MAVIEAEILSPPPPTIAVGITAAGSSQLIVGTAALLSGWSLHESTGTAAAVVTLYDGHDDTGQVLAVVALAGGASDTQWLGPSGVWCRSGVYLRATSGSVAGAVWVAPLPRGV